MLTVLGSHVSLDLSEETPRKKYSIFVEANGENVLFGSFKRHTLP